jgi:hypothetical protein
MDDISSVFADKLENFTINWITTAFFQITYFKQIIHDHRNV